jgi:hypothetical protein
VPSGKQAEPRSQSRQATTGTRRSSKSVLDERYKYTDCLVLCPSAEPLGRTQQIELDRHIAKLRAHNRCMSCYIAFHFINQCLDRAWLSVRVQQRPGGRRKDPSSHEIGPVSSSSTRSPPSKTMPIGEQVSKGKTPRASLTMRVQMIKQQVESSCFG